MSAKHPQPQPREPHIREHRWQFSLVWLVPIAATLVGLSMVLHSWLSAGPQITISFETAEGLEANKTQVKYKNVVIGLVTGIQLSDDRSRVIATVELDDSAEPFTRDDSQYWVVRPRIGSRGVSGVDTLLSGAFIGADAGRSETSRGDFIGLEAPPPVTYGAKGKRFTLQTNDLGSLDVGSPVYFRRFEVGQVVGYELSSDGKGVEVEIFINAPYDVFVTGDARFWNASGIDVNVSASGLQVNAQTLSTILAGGIAFRQPEYSPNASPVEEHAQFQLFPSAQSALAPPDGEPRYIQMLFAQSLRGLRADAPVEFLGVNIGRVVSVKLDYDAKTHSFPQIVGAVIYPKRLGEAHEKLLSQVGGDNEEHTAQLLSGLVERGLRAQARTGNLLTGQLYISLDFDSQAPRSAFNVNARPLQIPTVPGSFDRLQEQLQAMVDKLSKLPVDSLARNMDGSLIELRKTLAQVNSQVLPEIQGTLDQAQKTLANTNQVLFEESPQRQQLGQTMEEMQRTARSVRVLADFLGRHPEALIRGRGEDALPADYRGKATSRELVSEPQQ